MEVVCFESLLILREICLSSFSLLSVFPLAPSSRFELEPKFFDLERIFVEEEAEIFALTLAVKAESRLNMVYTCNEISSCRRPRRV